MTKAEQKRKSEEAAQSARQGKGPRPKEPMVVKPKNEYVVTAQREPNVVRETSKQKAKRKRRELVNKVKRVFKKPGTGNHPKNR